MKHIKALSKMDPKAAFSLPSKPVKTACDTFLKTPEEKDEKKGSEES
ncbi:MAG: hypothetical protein SGI88_12515 [Candidatus Hydrogenedentes bacterium]|nr:hypothetical protein [Candidatus Hydrogenedentota bacterium]